MLAGAVSLRPSSAPVNSACPPGSIPPGARASVPEGTVFAPAVFSWNPREALAAKGAAAKAVAAKAAAAKAAAAKTGAKGGGQSKK